MNKTFEVETLNSIGWPKGTTDCSTRELLEKVEQATQEAFNKFKEVKSEAKKSKHRLEKGSLQKIIDSTKEKFCILYDMIISANTVRQ
jgi:ribosomal protein L9